jgi:hypothetical protein
MNLIQSWKRTSGIAGSMGAKKAWNDVRLVKETNE